MCRRVPNGLQSLADASQQSGLSQVTLRRAIRDGRLPATAPDGWPNGYGIRPEDLAAFTAVEAARPGNGFQVMAMKAAEWRHEHGYLSVPEAAAAMSLSAQAVAKRIGYSRIAAERAPEDSPRPGAWLIREVEVVRDAA